MKQELTNYIIDHIFSNLGLTNPVRISLKQDIFRISPKIQYTTYSYEFGSDENAEADIYGAEITINNNKVKLLASQLVAVDKLHEEWYLLIKVSDQPTHGCSVITSDYQNKLFNGVMAFSLNKQWIPANAAAQASVLIGMELLSDAVGTWEKITDYKDLVKEIRSFVDYVDGVTDDGEGE